MKELVIISGKGGTGKTSIAASLAILAKNAVLVDCDVDAADLHLILKPEIKNKFEFWSGFVATIDKEKCIGCGKCKNVCRFDAIWEKRKTYEIDSSGCEGCKVCEVVCPVNAVKMKNNLCGSWYISETRCGTMIYAELKPGSENSGKLVSTVRQKAKDVAKEKDANFIIIDGPPGIGCPVIASIGGTSLALIVTEPTQSGLHDLDRVVRLTQHFKIPTFVCINKIDLNQKVATDIEKRCVENDIKIVGKIPYNNSFTMAMIEGLSLVEYEENEASSEIKKMWNNLKFLIEKKEE